MSHALRWFCDGCLTKLGDIRRGVLLVDRLPVAISSEAVAVTCPCCGTDRVWGRSATRRAMAISEPFATTSAM